MERDVYLQEVQGVKADCFENISRILTVLKGSRPVVPLGSSPLTLLQQIYDKFSRTVGRLRAAGLCDLNVVIYAFIYLLE